MIKMKVLNLYAGIGGNRKLWVDVEVTAVEIEPKIAKVYQEFFPEDKMVIGDAHQYLLDHYKEFDFIWSSPPCQSHSRMMKATRHDVTKYPDISLYQEIIFLQNFFNGQWVVENVKPYYTPLIKPNTELGRHIFWSNFYIIPTGTPKIPNFIVKGTVEDTEALKQWLGMNYKGNLYYGDNHCPGQVLRNCVHPDIGKHILDCARGKTVAPLTAYSKSLRKSIDTKQLRTRKEATSKTRLI